MYCRRREKCAPLLLTAACLLSAGDASAVAPPLPAVAALPVFATVEGAPAPVRLRGQLSPRRQRQAERVAGWLVTDVRRRFLRQLPTATRPAVDVCLFEDDRSYGAFVVQLYGDDRGHSPLCFYLPAARLVVANLGRSVGNLRHELAHALIGDDFPAIPTWVNEGIGALYGSAHHRSSGYRFLVNYRLRDLHAAQRDHSLPDFEALVRSGPTEVYGAEAMTYYAASRYLLLYLDRQGMLGDFYRNLRDRGASPQLQLALLIAAVDEAAYHSWAARLRYRRA